MNSIISFDKLRGKMIENHVNSKDLADKLHISRTSLSFKLNHKREFTDKEIFVLVNTFGSYILNLAI